MTPEMKKRYAAALQCSEDADDDTLHDTMLSRLEESSARKTELSQDLDAARLELSSHLPLPPTPEALYFAGEAVSAARNAAIANGAITAATATALEQALCRKPVAPDGLTLSRKVEDDDHLIVSGSAMLLSAFKALAGNKPAPRPGEQTGGQGLSLARDVPGQTDPLTDANNPLLVARNAFLKSQQPA